MKFNKIDYASTMGVEAYSEPDIYSGVERMLNADQTAFAMILLSAYLWYKGNKPFYRVWPSILEALSRMKLEKLYKVIPDFENYGPIAFELPKEYILKVDQDIEPGSQISPDDELLGFLAMVRGNRLILVPAAASPGKENGFSCFYFDASKYPTALVESQRVIARIALGVMLMSKSDDLFQAVVLNKDKERYEQTHNEKYVEKARRYGINGFDIGKDLPTVAEFQARARALGLSGKKAPHLRLMHPALYWTGKGRTTPIIKLIETTFVNYEDIRKLPQGYYIRKEREDEVQREAN